ncbi:MAG: DNA-binding response regulator [Bacteroidetes bacterium]|jgi:DNA-binding NarL/FixJ family response regulator|nr:DNA-binding response regulator [Bacteroidota bacterium]
MKVLIADDHPVVRRGVRQILVDEFDDCEVGEARSANQLMQLVSEQEWDIVLLDISLPDRNGLDVLKDLRVEYPELPVVILSMHPEDQFAVRVLRAGGVGYVTKESASEELTTAIRMGLKGQRYLSPVLARRLALESLANHPDLPLPITLSDRETQVLCLIAEGKTLTEMAESLSLSVKTVSTYRARLMEKVKAETNADLIHFAIANGYVTR